MGKYAKYSRHYCRDWENQDWAKGWLKEYRLQPYYNNNDTNEAYCIVCHTSLRAHLSDLKRHTLTKLHKTKFRDVNLSKKATVAHFVLPSATKKQKTVDLYLAMHVACHCSVRSIDHLGEILKSIANDSSLENLRLHRTKCAALINKVISVDLLSDVVTQVGNRRYSLIVDESTDVSVHKYLALCIRYFNEKENKIINDFLGLVEIEQATAECLFEQIKRFLSKIGLNLKNILAIGTDGASNLCGKNHSLYTLLRNEIPDLYLIKCICHSIHLAVSKASTELPSSLDFLAREIYNWFSCSPLRKLKYRQMFDLININENKVFNNFVQLSGTRWLVRYNVIVRILDHWLELTSFFDISKNSERCYTARTIFEMLKDERNELYFVFLKPILYDMNQLNLKFQSDSCDVGSAYFDMSLSIQSLSRRIIKPVFLSCDDQKDLLTQVINCIDNPLAFLSAETADLGYAFEIRLSKSKLSETEVTDLKVRCLQFLIKLLKELVEKLPSNIEVYKNVASLSADSLKKNERFENLPIIPFILKTENTIIIENQWRKLLLINWSNYLDENVLSTILSFWPAVFNFKDASDQRLFKDIAEVVLRMLSLPISNAVVERVFSVMNVVKTKKSNRMKLVTLDSMLRIRLYNYSRKKCCKHFVPSDNMLTLFNSNIYKSFETSNNETEMAHINLEEVITIFNESEI